LLAILGLLFISIAGGFDEDSVEMLLVIRPLALVEQCDRWFAGEEGEAGLTRSRSTEETILETSQADLQWSMVIFRMQQRWSAVTSSAVTLSAVISDWG
jgi:hypothetical protein